MNTLYEKIIDSPTPAFRGYIRNLTRKEWAQNVKRLLKDIGLGFISVTAPSYSMASSIHIRFKQSDPGPWEGGEHQREHERIDREQRGAKWTGYGTHCPHCNQEWQAHQRLERIILAAFPDLGDRSEYVSDHFDFCLSID